MMNSNKHRIKRLWQSVRFTLMRASSRKEYSERCRIFSSYGNNIVYQPKTIPLYPQLIKLHNNIVIGRNVEFVTHDVVSVVLRRYPDFAEVRDCFSEMCGCIEVMDNVFIGNGAIIMYGVRIAENTIIAAGSVVTKSTEPNSVYAGVPAKRIGSVSDVGRKRLDPEAVAPLAPVRRNLHITEGEIAEAWRRFNEVNDC